MKRKAEIHRTVIGSFYYNLVADNSEILVSSECFTRKQSITKVLKKYFPTFKIVDLTK